jgi:hypothetical protein
VPIPVDKQEMGSSADDALKRLVDQHQNPVRGMHDDPRLAKHRLPRLPRQTAALKWGQLLFPFNGGFLFGF